MSGTQEGSKYSKTKSVASTAPEGQYLWDNHGERIAELDWFPRQNDPLLV